MRPTRRRLRGRLARGGGATLGCGARAGGIGGRAGGWYGLGRDRRPPRRPAAPAAAAAAGAVAGRGGGGAAVDHHVALGGAGPDHALTPPAGVVGARRRPPLDHGGVGWGRSRRGGSRRWRRGRCRCRRGRGGCGGGRSGCRRRTGAGAGFGGAAAAGDLAGAHEAAGPVVPDQRVVVHRRELLQAVPDVGGVLRRAGRFAGAAHRRDRREDDAGGCREGDHHRGPMIGAGPPVAVALRP